MLSLTYLQVYQQKGPKVINIVSTADGIIWVIETETPPIKTEPPPPLFSKILTVDWKQTTPMFWDFVIRKT